VADIFVSYTKSDRDWGFWIAQELNKLGHVAHIHEWEVLAGGNIASWMEERHDKADHILCVISRVYLTKPYSSWERLAAQWAAARDRPNFALPVFVEDCKAPTMLAPFKRCDLFDLNEDEARAALAAYMNPVGPSAAAPVPFPAQAKHGVTETTQLNTSAFPGSNQQRNSASTTELHNYGIERAIVWIGAILLSSFIYFHFVFRDIHHPNELQGPSGAFFISAIAMGVVCSMLGFEKPIQATFITSSPAPVICVLAYLGIGRAWAAFPDLTPLANFLLNLIFSMLYGVLAVFGCVIGLKFRAIIESFVHKTEAIRGGDPITAAKIATTGTMAAGLLALLGTVIGAYIKQ
jgi:hypothetical protein